MLVLPDHAVAIRKMPNMSTYISWCSAVWGSKSAIPVWRRLVLPLSLVFEPHDPTSGVTRTRKPLLPITARHDQGAPPRYSAVKVLRPHLPDADQIR